MIGVEAKESCSELDEEGNHCLVKQCLKTDGVIDWISLSRMFIPVHQDFCHKDEKELDAFHNSIFQRSLNTEQGNKQRLAFTWKVRCGSLLASSYQEHTVCKFCFMHAYQLSAYRIKKLSDGLKTSTSSLGSGTATMSRRKSNDHSAVSLSCTEVRNRIADNVLTPPGRSDDIGEWRYCY